MTNCFVGILITADKDFLIDIIHECSSILCNHLKRGNLYRYRYVIFFCFIIQNSRKQQEEKRRNKFKRIIRNIEVTAAVVCILFTAALNTSPVFAKEMGQLPVIGELIQIVTFRSYETEKDDIAVSVPPEYFLLIVLSRDRVWF